MVTFVPLCRKGKLSMLLKKIILRNKDKFELVVEDWSNRMKIQVEVFDGKESLTETVDSLVILHEDHNISKENKNCANYLSAITNPLTRLILMLLLMLRFRRCVFG